MTNGTAAERELAYYKRLLDELAAARLDTEHLQWALAAQLRQKNQGFLLLSRLTRTLAGQTDAEAVFRTTVAEVNRVLGMDRTIALLPDERSYRPAHFAGVDDERARELAGLRFALAELLDGDELRLVGPGEATPAILRLRQAFGLASFVCVPVVGQAGPMGVVVSGRTRHDPRFNPPLDQGDAETFRAIASTLAAVVQNTRLTLREETFRWKEQFFAELSHELRTPLSLVSAPLAQVLAGRWGELPEAAAARLRVVERNQARLLELVNEILELARLQAGAAELRVEPIDDVPGLVRECAAHFRAAAEARGLELRLELDDELDGTVLHADRAKLDRLLFNLLSNAFKFTDAGHIEARCRRVDDELELAVSDTGVGMSSGEIPGIFTRFVSRTEGRPAGTGIGLALVEEIATRHGGRVSVMSQKGIGSCFMVRLPLGAPAASPPLSGESALTDEALNRWTESVFDPGRAIVLCVEDDADLRGHLRDVLAAEFNVFLAADGLEGLAKARRYLPDVIVSDQMMPRMAGRELLAAIRADADLAPTPVAFLTARQDRASRIDSLVAGADDYIAKPFDEAELCARVRNLVRGRAQARELAEANRRLELRVREQMAALVHTGELERYLAPAVVARVRRSAGAPDHPAEERAISLLVVELTGLAGGNLPPASHAALVDDYLGAVTAMASARGGTVDSLAGGRLSVLFGAPEPRPEAESAWNAAQTAVEVRARLLELGAAARRRGLPDVDGRLGLASGPALVGALGGEGLRAFTALGTPVEVAARLAAGAGGARIRCDEATRALLADRLPEHAFRGSEGGFELVALDPGPRRAPPPRPKASLEPVERVFRREGDYWTIVYDGAVCRLRDMKGLEYLARLLLQPHVEVHALDLAASEARLGHTEDAGPALDAAAKRAYKNRLRELDEELAEAQAFADHGRVARLEAELDLLARQLSSAVGLGGRDRPTASLSERARINVSRAVKAAIDKIAVTCEPLARHLRVSVRTGMFCAYAPHPGVPDRWDAALGG